MCSRMILSACNSSSSFGTWSDGYSKISTTMMDVKSDSTAQRTVQMEPAEYVVISSITNTGLAISVTNRCPLISSVKESLQSVIRLRPPDRCHMVFRRVKLVYFAHCPFWVTNYTPIAPMGGIISNQSRMISPMVT